MRIIKHDNNYKQIFILIFKKIKKKIWYISLIEREKMNQDRFFQQ